MAKVSNGCLESLTAMPQTRLESRPAEGRKPTIRIETLPYTLHQSVMDHLGDKLRRVVRDAFHFRRVEVGYEFAIYVVVTGREGKNHVTEADQILRFRCEESVARRVDTIIEWADTDGVPGGYKRLLFVIVEYEGKFSIQHPEERKAILMV